MAAKDFTKTLGSAGPEALSSSTIFAEYEVFLDCPASNSGAMTFYNEDDQILMVLEPGTRDRYKVDKTRAPNSQATNARDYLGGVARVGGADVVIYKNGGFGKVFKNSAGVVVADYHATSVGEYPVQGSGNPDAVSLFTLSSWSVAGTSGDKVYVNCR